MSRSAPFIVFKVFFVFFNIFII